VIWGCDLLFDFLPITGYAHPAQCVHNSLLCHLSSLGLHALLFITEVVLLK